MDSNPVVDATGNAHGVTIVADGTTLKGLEVENADEDGFLLVSSHNTLIDNESHDNGGAGFLLIDSSGNTLVRNSANDNGGGDSGGDGFTLLALPFGVGSSDNRLTANRATGNGGYGFYVDALLANLLEHNSCDGNGSGGSNQAVIC